MRLDPRKSFFPKVQFAHCLFLLVDKAARLEIAIFKDLANLDGLLSVKNTVIIPLEEVDWVGLRVIEDELVASSKATPRDSLEQCAELKFLWSTTKKEINLNNIHLFISDHPIMKTVRRPVSSLNLKYSFLLTRLLWNLIGISLTVKLYKIQILFDKVGNWWLLKQHFENHSEKYKSRDSNDDAI